MRAIKPADAGTYKLIATNPAGTLEIEAALVVTAAAKVAGAPVSGNLASTAPATILQQALGANPTSGQTYRPPIDTVEDGSETVLYQL